MKDPGAATGGAPTPVPPWGDADRQMELYRHFVEHSDRYTREALTAAAMQAGYTADDAARAWARVDREGDKVPSSRFQRPAQLLVIGLYAATFALFTWGSDLVQETYGVGAAILGVLLLLTGLVSLAWVGRSRQVPKEPALAVAMMLAVPFVLLVIVAGLCVASTGPTFFGRAA